jgi:hypothetical protein
MDPIAVWVQSNHPLVHRGGILLGFVTSFGQRLVGRLYIHHRDRYMGEAEIRFLIPVAYSIIVITLSAIVMSELDQALTIEGELPMRWRIWAVNTKEVKVELILRK